LLPHLTICVPAYDNGEMVREQQRVIADYPAKIRQRVTLIVVDDASPHEPVSEWMVEPEGYALQVYRVIIDEPWHHRAARNLATHLAPEGWMLVTDIDHVLPAGSAERLFNADLRPDCYYIPGRRLPDGTPHHAHPNSYILERSLYWDRVGGCDEEFNGYYGGDGPFRNRVAMFGQRVELPDVELVVYNLDGRDLTEVKGAATRAWGRKGTHWHSRQHPEVKARMKNAHLKRPENVLQFQWVRVR
jgi:hypothetical protein